MEHTEEETKKRWGNQRKTRPGLWRADALVESWWVVWSSKMTAPSRKQNSLFYLSVSEAFVMMGTTLLVFSFYSKENHLHRTKMK